MSEELQEQGVVTEAPHRPEGELAPVKKTSKAKATRPVVRAPSLEAAFGKLEALCAEVTEAEDQDGALEGALVRRFQDAKLETIAAVDARIEELLAVKAAIPAAKAMRDAWGAKARVFERFEEFAKERTKELLEAHPDLPRAGTVGRLAIEGNGGVLPLDLTFGDKELTEDLIAMFEIDERFFSVRTTYTLSTDAVRNALAAGEEIPWATLGERGSHLKVRA